MILPRSHSEISVTGQSSASQDEVFVFGYRCTLWSDYVSVVVKTFVKKNQDRDIGAEVARPRPRPWLSELKCTSV